MTIKAFYSFLLTNLCKICRQQYKDTGLAPWVNVNLPFSSFGYCVYIVVYMSTLRDMKTQSQTLNVCDI